MLRQGKHPNARGRWREPLARSVQKNTMITPKTRLFLLILLFIILPGCDKTNTTTPIFSTPSELVTPLTSVISTATPTLTPWPMSEFLISPITEIVVEEKQPNSNEWETFVSNQDVQIGDIYDIAFGVDGSVWFASGGQFSGIIKYKDGEWKNYTPGNGYSIFHKIAVTDENIVYVIATAPNAVSDYRIIGKFDKKNWTWWTDVRVAVTSDFVITPDNQIWVSLNDGVLELNGNNWVYKDMNHPITHLSSDGTMWSDGRWFIKNGKWVEVPYSAEYFLPGIQSGEGYSGVLFFINFGLENSIWYKIKYYGFVHVYETGRFNFYRTVEYTQNFSTLNGLVTDDGVFWFSGYDGIFNFDGKHWNHIKYGDGTIISMEKSPNGEIWFGGTAGEIYRYTPQK